MCEQNIADAGETRADGRHLPALFSLDGDDWEVTGLWRNQTAFSRAFTGKALDLGSPAVPPVPATVPGAVNADLMRAGLAPDYNVGWGSLGHEWVEHREWIYEKRFRFPPKRAGETHVLCFDGLDYEGEILLNGRAVQSFRGTCLPVEADVTDLLTYGGENTLQVLFTPAPEVDGMYGHTSRGRHLKARFSYLWDWCARVVPVGVWDHVYILSHGPVWLEGARARGDYMEGRALLRLFCAVRGLRSTGRLDVRVCPCGGEEPVFSCRIGLYGNGDGCRVDETFRVEGAEPWQPNGCGEARLYAVELALWSGDALVHTARRRVGFRHVEMAPNPGAPAGAPPYTLKVNGRRLFMKGVNWVPASMLFGCTSRGDYLAFLGRFRDMNCNLLRVWGGGVIEKREFYEACDELGLMVWQELMQSSSAIENCPPDDPVILRELRAVAASAMRRRGDHPSHAIWCGGNELTATQERGIPASLDHPNLRMLSDLAAELDPGKPFLPCSPFGPDVFGDANKYGEGNQFDVHGRWHYAPDHYDYYNKDNALLRSEVGTAGLSSAGTLRAAAGSLNPWPPKPDNPFWAHHGAWWNQWELLTGLFGPWDENRDQLEAFAQASQYMQMESLRYALESARRRAPMCGGAVVWMGNEPYANAANTSLLEYNGRPKAAYYAARRAFAPVHATCRYDKIGYMPGESFCADVFLHDDRVVNRAGLALSADLCREDGARIVRREWHCPATDEPVRRMGSVRWAVPPGYAGVFFLRLRAEADGKALCENTYVFTCGDECALRPLQAMPGTKLELKVGPAEPGSFCVAVRNVGMAPAVMLTVECENPLALCGDGAVVVFPGESAAFNCYGFSPGPIRALAMNSHATTTMPAGSSS